MSPEPSGLCPTCIDRMFNNIMAEIAKDGITTAETPLAEAADKLHGKPITFKS